VAAFARRGGGCGWEDGRGAGVGVWLGVSRRRRRYGSLECGDEEEEEEEEEDTAGRKQRWRERRGGAGRIKAGIGRSSEGTSGGIAVASLSLGAPARRQGELERSADAEARARREGPRPRERKKRRRRGRTAGGEPMSIPRALRLVRIEWRQATRKSQSQRALAHAQPSPVRRQARCASAPVPTVPACAGYSYSLQPAGGSLPRAKLYSPSRSRTARRTRARRIWESGLLSCGLHEFHQFPPRNFTPRLERFRGYHTNKEPLAILSLSFVGFASMPLDPQIIDTDGLISHRHEMA
jgi:hypothetical protein